MKTSHRKTRHSINEPGQAHFLTFSCWKRWPLLNRDRSRQWMIDSLASIRETQNVDLWAYVIMPEHVHVLLMPTERDYEMRRILAAIKSPVSRSAKAYLEEAGNADWLARLTVRHGTRETFRFWLPGGGYDENLWTERSLQEVIDYIHANPVRRGLVECPTDWYWSSASIHAGLTSGPLEIDQMPIC